MSGVAFGAPGIEPRWTRAAKDAVGTAKDRGSPVWFTISSGILNEVYYPTIDHPQIRDLQFLITDGETFFHDERRDLESSIVPIQSFGLGYVVTNKDPGGRYELRKEIITDPESPTVVIHTHLIADAEIREKLRVFVLCAPHLDIGGYGNNGVVLQVNSRDVLAAWRGSTWLALGANRPFLRRSVGYVGASDGWQDLHRHRDMTWEFDEAPNGNIALTGEIDFSDSDRAVVTLAFGDHQHGALTAMFQGLGHDFEDFRQMYGEQWSDAESDLLPLGGVAGDGGVLYRTSAALLMAHEDKHYAGAFIASLSIPWGDERGDGELGGYHLVWTRDMVNSGTGLLAAGKTEAPLRALIYLAATQHADGGFPQNFWISGEPYWHGVQLDEVAFPVLLAWRLWNCGGLEQFDPYPMMKLAAGYIIRNGPVTPQERWEEASGYSPSTLASNIAALICVADIARVRGDSSLADFLEDYADFLEARVETWTVTNHGTLLDGVTRHYIRINPVNPADPEPDHDPDVAMLVLANQPPGGPYEYPAKEIVDAGFLELVRYGIRPPGDPLIEASLRVVDHTLRFESLFGPAFYRYNHDGYGQRDDGSGYDGWGQGRPWPLLTGERGHYEFAAGRDAMPYVRALERFAHGAGLLPEQIWDRPDIAERGLFLGRPTGAAMPLMWAHAEYIKLLRSLHDGATYDRIAKVADRYRAGRGRGAAIQVWKPNRHARTVVRGGHLRVLAPVPFQVTVRAGDVLDAELTARDCGAQVWYVEVAIPDDLAQPLHLAFRGVDLPWARSSYELRPVDLPPGTVASSVG